MTVRIWHNPALHSVNLSKEVTALFDLMPPDYSVGISNQGLYFVGYGLKRVHIPSHLSKDYDTWAKAFQEAAAP